MSNEELWKRVDKLLCEIHEDGFHTGNLENAMEQRDALKMQEVFEEDFAIWDRFIEKYLQELADLIKELMRNEVAVQGKRISEKEIALLGDCLHILVWEKFNKSCTNLEYSPTFKFDLHVDFNKQRTHFYVSLVFEHQSVFHQKYSHLINTDTRSVGEDFRDSNFDDAFSQLVKGFERRFEEVSVSGEYQVKDMVVTIKDLK